MEFEIYQNTLESQGVRTTQTYDIRRLFYVAFFGGIIAFAVLAARNARWLKVSPGLIRLLLTLSFLLFAGEISLYVAYFQGWIRFDIHLFRFVVRAPEILLYGVFYLMVNKSYTRVLYSSGTVRPLLRDALTWCLISNVIAISIIALLLLLI